MCGDYEFETKSMGLSGASGKNSLLGSLIMNYTLT